MKKIGAIILAAGQSSRLGRPKQLLEIEGKTLIQHTTEVVNQGGFLPITIVLGAFAKEIEPITQNLPAYTIKNLNWQQGMGSSIKAGMEMMEVIGKKIDAVLILVCDQPLLNELHLKKLIASYQEGNSLVVASTYEKTVGVPAIFDRQLFNHLHTLQELGGAKKLIRHHLAQTQQIPFPEGAFDIDTEEDYQRFLKRHLDLKR